ncbi:hypothetical protein GL58_05760 [Comamonas testosteroni]|uniref:Uncharacterized protein n=1 Tax=Comamonas testosteroni TaxID=285 RepID=A0A0L7MMY9_COMTE|nr:hypothetical protein GL58_05760 [Comamonas testosteroni]
MQGCDLARQRRTLALARLILPVFAATESGLRSAGRRQACKRLPVCGQRRMQADLENGFGEIGQPPAKTGLQASQHRTPVSTS